MQPGGMGVESRTSGVRTALPRTRSAMLSRLGVLLSLYVVAVFLSAPFYLDTPPAPGAGEVIRTAPIEARVPFAVALESRQREWEARREREHKRVWLFQSEAETRAKERLEEILVAIERMDAAGEPAELQVSLSALDAEFKALLREEAPRFVTALSRRDLRDRIRSITQTVYRDYLVVAGLSRFIDQQRLGVVLFENEQELETRRGFRMSQRQLTFPVDYNYRWENILREGLAPASGDPPLPEEDERFVRRVLKAAVQPDLVYDVRGTKSQFDTFPAVGDTFFEVGTVLLGAAMADRPLSAEQAHILAAHRKANFRQANYRLLGHAAYILVVFLVLQFYLSRERLENGQFTPFNIVLVSIPVLLPLLLQYIVIILAEWRTDVVGFLFPAGAIGMLGVLLLDVRMALLLVTWGCLLFGLQVDLQLEFVIVAIFGGYTAVAALHTIRRRYDAIVASVLVGIVNAMVILVVSFIQEPLAPLPIKLAAVGFIGGFLSFLVLAILPLIERFGVVTDMQLLELSGLHNPLLRSIEEQAPGTWQHTLNVAKLAEAAATEIGVNYLLVRAGCYYHDIGKVKKPEFFTENQVSPEDKARHENLKPIMSARIIMNHVKEGVEMGRAAGLPQRIIDFITQHHGTSLIAYFHRKAEAAYERGESKDMVREDDYRYPGPKPQNIEAAIVMLADSVEATATAKLSAKKVREDEIHQIVATTILEKFNDGQFNECNLTLRDLNIIREVFIRVLKSRFHTRIDYPKKGSGGTRSPIPLTRSDDSTGQMPTMGLSKDTPPPVPSEKT